MSETASVPPPTGATRSIASDALGTMVIRAAGIALLFASTTATAVLLGPTEYGEFSAALSLALLFATAAPLGTDRVLVRRLSIIGREAAGSEVSLTHRCSLWPALVIACGSLLTAAACSAMGYSAWSRTLTLAVLMALAADTHISAAVDRHSAGGDSFGHSAGTVSDSAAVAAAAGVAVAAAAAAGRGAGCDRHCGADAGSLAGNGQHRASGGCIS